MDQREPGGPPPTPDLRGLLELMRRLRDPRSGCPWDQRQDFDSILEHTLEEAYEVADAIGRGDMAALRDELGDLLFQVVFHARLAEERGAFDFDVVVATLVNKLVRRHPHVFADARLDDEAELRRAWEAHKAEERRHRAEEPPSELDEVPLGLPSLSRAQKLQRRAARVGFDWPDPEPVLAKVAEELRELSAELGAGGEAQRRREELGDLLFASVNLARHLHIDAERALREANLRFEARFRYLEARVRAAGGRVEDCSLEQLDAYWEQAKAALRAKPGQSG